MNLSFPSVVGSSAAFGEPSSDTGSDRGATDARRRMRDAPLGLEIWRTGVQRPALPASPLCLSAQCLLMLYSLHHVHMTDWTSADSCVHVHPRSQNLTRPKRFSAGTTYVSLNVLEYRMCHNEKKVRPKRRLYKFGPSQTTLFCAVRLFESTRDSWHPITTTFLCEEASCKLYDQMCVTSSLLRYFIQVVLVRSADCAIFSQTLVSVFHIVKLISQLCEGQCTEARSVLSAAKLNLLF